MQLAVHNAVTAPAAIGVFGGDDHGALQNRFYDARKIAFDLPSLQSTLEGGVIPDELTRTAT
jgi:hypothetical protein